MFKTKPLRPAFREKKRYIVYRAEVNGDGSMTMREIQKALVRKLNGMLGVFDGAIAGIIPVKFDESTFTGIICVNHMAVDRVKGCFALIGSLEKTSVRISSVGVSGILKKADESYFQV